MENSFTPARRRMLAIGFTLGLLALAWLARDSLWQVAQAAVAEAERLTAECTKS